MTISDIEAEARSLVDADSTSYPAAVLLRRENAAYEEIIGKLLGIDGTWEFDDTNYSSFPIGTATMIAGQQDYSFDITFLQIERVEVLDQGGIWHLLLPLDKSQVDVALSEFFKTNGLPFYYDKSGGSIILYPAPDSGTSVTLSSGLKVYFKRTASIFTSAEQTTGTKVPGFASPFHVLISYKAALPYALTYKKDRVPLLLNEINRLEKGLEAFYSQRTKDERKIIRPKGISFK